MRGDHWRARRRIFRPGLAGACASCRCACSARPSCGQGGAGRPRRDPGHRRRDEARDRSRREGHQHELRHARVARCRTATRSRTPTWCATRSRTAASSSRRAAIRAAPERFSPACLDGVIAVGAVDSRGQAVQLHDDRRPCRAVRAGRAHGFGGIARLPVRHRHQLRRAVRHRGGRAAGQSRAAALQAGRSRDRSAAPDGERRSRGREARPRASAPASSTRTRRSRRLDEFIDRGGDFQTAQPRLGGTEHA